MSSYGRNFQPIQCLGTTPIMNFFFSTTANLRHKSLLLSFKCISHRKKSGLIFTRQSCNKRLLRGVCLLFCFHGSIANTSGFWDCNNTINQGVGTNVVPWPLHAAGMMGPVSRDWQTKRLSQSPAWHLEHSSLHFIWKAIPRAKDFSGNLHTKKEKILKSMKRWWKIILKLYLRNNGQKTKSN